MSFWEKLKPAAKQPIATRVELSADRRTLLLTWDDGAQAGLPVRLLRQKCPCAECVEEWTGRRTLDVDAVPQDIGVSQVSTVGNYALNLTFTDSHASGIFHWPHLRALSEPPKTGPTSA